MSTFIKSITQFPGIAEILHRFEQKGYQPDPLFMAHVEEGLAARASGLTPDKIQNTYLKNFEIPQIVLFDILANRFPLVLEAQKIVTKLLLQQAQHARHICIIDLGIGRGLQMEGMLRNIHHNLPAESVTLMGIELTSDALEYTTHKMEELRKELKFQFKFIPILQSIEDLSIESLKKAMPADSDFIMINASLVLHHIQKDSERNELFLKLKALHPNVVSLIEPHASTFTDHFETRLYNACEHFCALYHFTDSLPLTDAEKKGLKTFFSNDFFDPIALPDEYRFEKLERGEDWISRAKNAEFKPLPLDELISPNAIPGIVTSGQPDEYVNFSFEGTALLSTIAMKAE